ncbi:MAG: hypothetical protein AB7P69_16650 [Candidatus Binatia bacterium]
MGKKLRGGIAPYAMTLVGLAMVTRKGKKEIDMGHSRVLVHCVCSMPVCSGWMQMKNRQDQQRRE